ncbi:uncharacterized protein LOC127708109 [Mytilus californianus]|uniref:uncharacterized protein LOC127708109 n=1 Tax=Mytilus californianus TaxID=6549 RepID=UPI002245A9A8|nr:uncharacterized protein LOC127708109 [Mytilus californianus]
MTAITATLHLKTGEKKEFSYPCLNNEENVSLTEIHISSVILQQKLNTVLTTLIEEEKSKLSKLGEKSADKDDEENYDDGDDDDDEENGLSPPDQKRQKT